MKKIIPLLGLLLIMLVLGCNKDNDIISGIPDDDIVVEEIPVEDRLPMFDIDTDGNSILDEPKIDAQMTITVAGEESYTGPIGIEIRGSSSQMFPKKQYGFETRDDANEDLSVPLLDYPEEEDWILYAPYSDKSLLRNTLIYELSNDIGRYASRTSFVEVSLNGNYNGLYVFMEKLKRDNGRIDLNNLNEDENTGDDVTGGYILKIDKSDNQPDNFYTENDSFKSTYAPPNSTSGQQIRFLYDDPDPEDITVEQKEYIQNYVQSFEDALASENFTDEVLGYRNYIETESFIDFFLLTEISNNVDGYRLSTWLTKDKNGKLNMGPIWDFNLAFGNANYCGGERTDVWAYEFNERCPDDFWQIPFWWDRLLEDPEFVDELKSRWNELRGSSFSTSSISNKIDDYVLELDKSGSIKANFDRWPVLGTYVWPNNFVGQKHDDEMQYLREWVSARLSWMDSAINGL